MGDVITFNQQYYMGYIGAQFRRSIVRECRRPIDLMFQVDYGGVGGYNVDHHLLRTPAPRYTFESTGGDQIHFSLDGNIPVNCHLNAGLKVDYLRIRTTGTHRLTEPGTDDLEQWRVGKVRADRTYGVPAIRLVNCGFGYIYVIIGAAVSPLPPLVVLRNKGFLIDDLNAFDGQPCE